MRTYIKSVIFLFTFSFLFSTYGSTWTVEVTNFQFTPSNFNVSVGDSIKWVLITGDHTTTSISVPTGALSWDSPININTPTYIYVPAVAGLYQYKCTPHFPTMTGSFTATPIGIIPISSNVPEKFNLYQNYPNPFNPVTKIKFDIPSIASGSAKLTVYNILGSEVASLVNEQLNAGTYEVKWNASNYPSGVYFYTLQAGAFTETKKITLIK